ncbi:MAG: cyclase family protein [Verrucomicrobiae bacterium]|nr:cyclase family protein [Verrucomicrobiae bacterium]
MTHTLDPDFPTFGGDAQVTVRTVSTLAADGWNMREWQFNEHTGTHLDAPLHRTAGGMSVDAVPVEALIGPLAVIDLRARAERDPDTPLTPDDVRGWEARHGRLPDGAIVALCSGWGAHARSARFRGADAAGRLHFPGFHEFRAGHGVIEARIGTEMGNEQMAKLLPEKIGSEFRKERVVPADLREPGKIAVRSMNDRPMAKGQ